jgi:thymidylate synthase (FAD)
MPQAEPRVEILAHTPGALSLIYAAFRQCYHAGFVGDMWEKLVSGEITRERQAEFVRRLMDSGHASPIEHVTFTFAISGVSRAFTHQLVRHRIASYSQQSQRYVDGGDFNYIMPPAVAKNPAARRIFEKTMEELRVAYRELKQKLEECGCGKAAEDARFVLPQAVETRIVVSMNCRSLLNFFEQRCCNRAQWEIRQVANKCLELCREALPAIFVSAGARCEKLGYCPEGENFTCGRYPLFRPPAPAE